MSNALFSTFQVGPLASIAGVIASMCVLLIFIHWKQLKRPYMALMKLAFMALCVFAMGTLPWQQHFIGLLGGILGGTALTITLVPFLSVSKYARNSKVRLTSCNCKFLEEKKIILILRIMYYVTDQFGVVMCIGSFDYLFNDVDYVLSLPNDSINDWQLVWFGYKSYEQFI